VFPELVEGNITEKRLMVVSTGNPSTRNSAVVELAVVELAVAELVEASKRPLVGKSPVVVVSTDLTA